LIFGRFDWEKTFKSRNITPADDRIINNLSDKIDDPFTTEYLTGWHAIQSVNSSLSNVSTFLPAGHLLNIVNDDDPFTPEYLPGSHVIQSVNSSPPDAWTYLPAGHIRHVEDPFTSEYVPLPQSLQFSEPFTLLHFPIMHIWQEP
jgi:hypothetical protein